MLPLVLVLQTALLVQDGVRQEPPRFRSASDLVVLHVTVVTPKSGFVADLPQEAFTVLEDGRPQAIRSFERADSPVTVGLLIDNSISMMRRRRAVIAAGMSFAESCHPDDLLFTINFNERVWPGLPADRLFTSDREELERALRQTTARGQNR